jgi:hypothetical protein
MTDAKEPLVRYEYRLSVRDDSAHRDAERAVIEAAKAMVNAVYPPKIENYREYMTAVDNLVSTIRALGGDA